MVNLNGKIVQPDNETIGFDNRGLNYGDAIFETLRLSAGNIFFWEDHFQRLIASMQILKMEIPKNFTLEFLQAEVLKTTNFLNSSKKAFRVKILVWRKPGGKYTPKTNAVEYLITSESLDTHFYTLNKTEYEVEVFEDHFISASLLSTLKTNNKLINVLGSIFAEQNGFKNCLLLNEKLQIVEALNGNIFFISKNKIKTPPLSEGCLNGVMRKQIISILKEVLDYKFEEAIITISELQEVNEIFVTNVIQGIVPVTKFRSRTYGNELAKKLLPILNAKIGLV